jgi:hypothetical protein
MSGQQIILRPEGRLEMRGGHCRLPMPQARDKERFWTQSEVLVGALPQAKDNLQNAGNPEARNSPFLATPCPVPC